MRKLSRRFTLFMKPFLAILILGFIFASCSDSSTNTAEEETEPENPEEQLDPDAEYSFDGPAFDIASTENGTLLIADFEVVREIEAEGVTEITGLPLVEGPGAFGEPDITFINGLLSSVNGRFYAARSALDMNVGAGILYFNGNDTELIADIETFTIGDWPDGEPGQAPGWKNFNCEPPGGYSAAPYSNPYKVTAVSDNEMLLANAGGNSILRINTSGDIDVVATLSPILSPDTGEPKVLFPLEDGSTCFVEPVPTGVAIGPDGAYYVGELVGTAPENFGGEPTPEGLASVWRIEPGSQDVVCPSASCSKAVTGLNSIIDIKFGPDNQLYIVEFETSGYLAAVAPDLEIPMQGGRVKRCDIAANSCEIIEGGDGTLFLPGAITFDKWDNLWLLDNVFAPTVRSIEWQ